MGTRGTSRRRASGREDGHRDASRPAGRRWGLRLLGGALVVTLVAGCEATVPVTPQPSRAPGAEAPAPPDVPLLAQLSRPAAGPSAVGYPTLLRGSALGAAGIAGLELWDGATRVETARGAGARPAMATRWTWRPTVAGDHVLVLRAIDTEGRTATSAALRVTVAERPAPAVALHRVRAPGGQRLADVVAAGGGDPALAARRNPGLDPDSMIPAGTEVVVPVPVDQPEPPPADPADEFAPAAAFALALAEPQVTAAADGCAVRVSVSGIAAGATGLAIEDLAPGNDRFARVATLSRPAGDALTTTFPALTGRHVVSVAAYDGRAAVGGTLAEVEVGDGCPAPGWTGPVAIAGGRLLVPDDVDRAYAYVSVDGRPWTRVPADPKAFVKRVNGVLDVSRALPPLSGTSVVLEAWGWSGGSLVSLGTGAYQAPVDSSAVVPHIAFSASLDEVVKATVVKSTAAAGGSGEVLLRDDAITRPTEAGKAPIERTFRWSSGGQGITRLMWQITPFSLPWDPWLDPPGLLQYGYVDVEDGATSGDFTLDLRSLFPGAPLVGTLAGSQVPVGLLDPVVPGASGASGPYVPAPAGAIVPVAVAPGAASPAPAPTAGAGGGPAVSAWLASQAIFSVQHLYVRIVPLAGSETVGTASNPVHFRVDEPTSISIPSATPSGPDLYGVAASVYYPPASPDPSLIGCLRILKVDWVKLHVAYGKIVDPLYQYYDNLRATKTPLCPSEDDGGFDLADAFDAFVSVVSTAWDAIAETYAFLQDQIVNAVLTIVPCDKFVGLAGVDDADADSACRTAAYAALHTAMAAYGLPPELPTSGDLVTAAKGDLIELADTWARKTLPGYDEICDAADLAHQAKSSVPTCYGLISKALDRIQDEIAKAKTHEAMAETGLVVPEFVTAEVEPKGLPQPPHAKLTALRTAAPMPAGRSCVATLSVGSALAAWTWTVWDWSAGTPGGVPPTKKVSGPVGGRPFAPEAVVLPDPGPGKAVTVDIWLKTRELWFEPGSALGSEWPAKEYAITTQSAGANHAWVLLQKGATTTASMGTSCGGTVEVTKPISKDAW